MKARDRDTTADSPDWVFLGEFFQDIGLGDRVRFAVYRSKTDHARHRLTSDEMKHAGARLIAAFSEPATDAEEWHPAWQHDEMRPEIEAMARKIARG